MHGLGLSAADRVRHIAWDIGIAELGSRLADRIGATFIQQPYSRLVIDCNRLPGTPDSIPSVSDGTSIAANAELDAVRIAARVEAIHMPYHAAIAAELDRRAAEGCSTIFIALHSFTPVMRGFRRPWHVGVLHGEGNVDFALAMIDAFASDGALKVGDNEPYCMDTLDYTVPLHAYSRQLPYAEIEIRQDLLEQAAGVEQWARHVEWALVEAADRSRNSNIIF